MESDFAKTLIKNMAFYWTIFALLSPILFKPLISCLRKRKSSRNKKLTDGAIGSIFVLVLVLGFLAYITVPSAIDIANFSYCSVHGNFKVLRKSSYIDILVDSDDGDDFSLTVPVGSFLMRDNIPDNEFSGTVLYAENSKYVLQYIPD